MTTQVIATEIEKRVWREYINPPMGVWISIEDALLKTLVKRLKRHGVTDVMDVMAGVAGNLRQVVPMLKAIHRLGADVAQQEMLLSRLGLAVHYVSYAGRYYAAATPVAPYRCRRGR